MLEFREDFFEQEIRNGFYIDTTMKTVWASELELLQLVAEVCDRHGLTWYACYGTLLGAIRHEGFVPWDDDMDIVMKRKDYMKLLEVLPKELPEGYRVRSPQTDVGYEQYHTCINNGSGICITQEWLARNHGCPFTIGLDIFPLDYIPRNEEERKLQRTLVTLAGRLAQMAGVMADEKELPESDAEKTPEEYIADFKDGVNFLEETCKIHFDWDLIEEENWDKARSALWKVANELAMMYDESESDYLASYIDYVQWEHKKFPKEWFDEVWSASFEGFMLPIPCGYHEILTNSYGDYMVYRRKTGLHEYPYYARQLRQLREYVKDVEQRAGKAGIVSIDELEVQEEILDIPEEWLPIITKEDGSRKKIILSANDPAVYMAYGDEALDKLEKMLQQMEEASAEVALWWRPQPVMPKLLARVSAKLAERYQSILEKYKTAGWGICDETDNTDRAVEQCDVYYGEMNAILQPFQNAGKAAVIAQVEEVQRENNIDRIYEAKAFLNFTDFVFDEKKMYFANRNYNGLVIVNQEDWKVEMIIPFDVASNHLHCIKREGKICFLPIGNGGANIFDIKSRSLTFCDIGGENPCLRESWKSYEQGNDVYMLPCHPLQGLWRWDVRGNAMVREMWWEIVENDSFLEHGKIDDERFYSIQPTTGKIFITNVSNKSIEEFIMPDESITHVQYEDGVFWYCSKERTDIKCWDTAKGITTTYKLQCEHTEWFAMKIVEEKMFLFADRGRKVYMLNRQTREFIYVGDIKHPNWDFYTKDKELFYKQINNKLICMCRSINKLFIINLDSLEITEKDVCFEYDQNVRRYENSILISRGPLLYEESGRYDLEVLMG